MADLSEDEKALLNEVPKDGTTIGNIAVQKKLKWGDLDRYWTTRNALVERGLLLTGKGRGGTVRRRPEPKEEAKEGPPEEHKLYAALAGVLRAQWSRDRLFSDCVAEVTARQGSKSTGGTWTRPDITLAGTKDFLYVPRSIFEVCTFEVKTWANLDVTAVYEAFAHSRCSMRSYLIFQAEPKQIEEAAGFIDRITAEARRVGVGVVSVEKPDDYETWDEMVDAPLRQPEPDLLSEFVGNQLPEHVRSRILLWLKRA